VRIMVLDRPGKRQVVARVTLNGKNVSGLLVKEGYAWVSRKYARDNDLYWMELDARTRNVGLWSKMETVPKEP
jgi:endonuclease YncB( thermonuclease family)